MRRLFPIITTSLLLASCGSVSTPRDALPADNAPEIVTIRFQLEATPEGLEITDTNRLGTSSVPIDAADGPVQLILVDDSYTVGRRATYSEFLLAIRNGTDAALYAPELTVVEFLTRNRKYAARGEITTSDNGVTGVGATFDYGWSLGSEQRLAAGADSPPRRWRVEDPARGFEPYTLALELTYSTAPVDDKLPSTPAEVVADFRGEIDPATGSIEITDLRSPYLDIVPNDDADYMVAVERLDATFLFSTLIDDVFLDHIEISLADLRLVSNDPHRTVILDVDQPASRDFSQAIGAVGPGSFLGMTLPFKGVSTTDLLAPATLGKFTFRAQVTAQVDRVAHLSNRHATRAQPGEATRLELPDAAAIIVRDDLGHGVLTDATTVALREVDSDTLESRLQAFDLAASGPIVEVAISDPLAIKADFLSLNMRVTPELARAQAAGARLQVVEFSSMRSPGSVYWRTLPDYPYPEDIDAGWIFARTHPGNLLFRRTAGGERHTYYVLVAVNDHVDILANPASSANARTAPQIPFLLGPTETFGIDETVLLPEAERDFIPHLVNPIAPDRLLSETVACNTQEARDLGINDGGCSNDEVGNQEGRNNPHMGMDLRAWRGTEIYAAADGTVRFAGYVDNETQVYGCTVIVRHDNGYESLYAHLDAPRLPNGTYDCEFPVSKNEEVRAGGTVLGRSGGSGNVYLDPYPAHLHFSLSPEPFDIEIPNDSLFVSPRGICDQRNNVTNGVIGLSAKLHLSYPVGDHREAIVLAEEEFTGVDPSTGVGRCETDRVTLAYEVDREALLELIGSDLARTLSYVAIDYQWSGLSKRSGSFGPHKQDDSRRLYFDSVTPVGVHEVQPGVVTLDGSTAINGFGFGQMGEHANLDIVYHSATASGPSSKPDLEAVITGLTSTRVSSEIPGPSARISENAAWGNVGVRFENSRNRTYEETINMLEVAPYIDGLRVSDGVTTDRARGGKTIEVVGHGFLSGPAGEASFDTFIETNSRQGRLHPSHASLSPLGYEITVPDELFSGPATIGALVDSLEHEARGQVSIYPYIESSPRTGYSGEAVTVTGTGLGPDVTIKFRGAAATVDGTGTSASFQIPDGVRSGALSVVAAGQASGNGVRFVAAPTVTVLAVDSVTGESISANIDYEAVRLDDANDGVYDESSARSTRTARSGDRLLGSGAWAIEASAAGYEPVAETRDLTTTPVTVHLSLKPEVVVEPAP